MKEIPTMKNKIIGNTVYTSRENRNMLSNTLGIDSNVILGEKETKED